MEPVSVVAIVVGVLAVEHVGSVVSFVQGLL